MAAIRRTLLGHLTHLPLWSNDTLPQRRDPLSVSRLNHRLLRAQASPEVVQGTAKFPHQIAPPVLPYAALVLHAATALDTAVPMLAP